MVVSQLIMYKTTDMINPDTTANLYTLVCSKIPNILVVAVIVVLAP